MSFDTPYVEYFVIGTHTSLWLMLIVMAVLGIPIHSLSNLSPGLALLMLPLVYLLGAISAAISNFPLDPFRKRIGKSVLPNDQYKDELIAYLSPELYSAYESRAHRARLMGASIFNWIFLGIALLFHVGFSNPSYYIPASLIPAILAILSAVAWRAAIKRMFKFRKNAIEVIRENPQKGVIPTSSPKANKKQISS